jgi:adenylosuccinate synthase
MSKAQNDIVIGLTLGDEGKGTIVDYLATQREKPNAVVRFSGGVQAAHNVIMPDGLHHTFAQLGSASFHGVRTILSRYMLVDPFGLALESSIFYEKTGFDALTTLLASENALMTTPIHAAINKKREILRGADMHGSCGVGVGETQNYFNQVGWKAPKLADLLNPSILMVKLEYLLDYAMHEVGDISDLIPSFNELKCSYVNFADDKVINIVSDDYISKELRKGYNIFEGSQGVLLDERRGFHPHTTWSTTTQERAQILLKEANLERGNVIGVTRSYATRHGAGPMPSELKDDKTVSLFPENHNGYGVFQGGWRIGDLDLPLLEYGTRANGGVDEVAITHLDIPYKKAVTSYKDLDTIPTDYFNENRQKQEVFLKGLNKAHESKVTIDITSEEQLVGLVEDACKAPCTIKSYGPTWRDKKAV